VIDVERQGERYCYCTKVNLLKYYPGNSYTDQVSLLRYFMIYLGAGSRNNIVILVTTTVHLVHIRIYPGSSGVNTVPVLSRLRVLWRVSTLHK
jgi:hypothetical protein